MQSTKKNKVQELIKTNDRGPLDRKGVELSLREAHPLARLRVIRFLCAYLYFICMGALLSYYDVILIIL